MAKEGKRKKREPVDPNETKSQRFVRLGNARGRKAIAAIRNVGALFAPTYEWTPEQGKRLLEALESEVKKARGRFDSGGKVEAKLDKIL